MVATTADYIEQDRYETHGSQFQGTRVLKCSWADRLTVMKQLKGGWQYYEGVGYAYVTPDPYPDFTGACCHDVEIRPWGGNQQKTTHEQYGYGQRAVWEYAELTVHYGVPNYATRTVSALSGNGANGKVAVSESWRGTTEFMTMPGNAYWDDEGNEQINTEELPGLIIYGGEWVVTFHDLIPSEIPDAMFCYSGYVNSETITSPKYNFEFAPLTLLATDPETSERNNTEGTATDDLTRRFLWRPNTWDKWPKPGDDGKITWSSIYNADGARIYIYQEHDFSSITPQD